MKFKPNYRILYNSFTIAILIINVLYCLKPPFDFIHLAYIGCLFIIFYFISKKTKITPYQSFALGSVFYFVVELVPYFFINKLNFTSFEIGFLLGKTIVSIFKRTIAYGIIINGIVSLYERKDFIENKKQKEENKKAILGLRFKLIPITIFSLVILSIPLFLLIYYVPGLVDIVDNVDMINRPLTYSLLFLIPLYHFTKILIIGISEVLIRKKERKRMV
jgi:hypothetical protein